MSEMELSERTTLVRVADGVIDEQSNAMEILRIICEGVFDLEVVLTRQEFIGYLTRGRKEKVALVQLILMGTDYGVPGLRATRVVDTATTQSVWNLFKVALGLEEPEKPGEDG